MKKLEDELQAAGRLQHLPKLPGFLDSASKLGQSGYELKIKPSPLLTSDWSQINWDSKIPQRYNELGMLSFVEGGKSLIQEGMDIWIEEGEIWLQLNKPESIIRWGGQAFLLKWFATLLAHR